VAKHLRLGVLAVAAFAVVPVVSACSTSPGAAALVGNTRITTGQLQAQVHASLADGKAASQQGFNRTTFTQQLLSHMINVDLLNAAAAAHHVSVSRQDISAETASFVQQTGSYAALQQQAAEGGVSKAQLPGFIRYAALEKNLTTALINTLPVTSAQLAAEYRKDIDQFDQLQVAQISVKTKALAHHILAKVRRTPSSFASLAQKYSLDTTTKANGGVVGYVGRSAVQKALGSGVSVAPGTFAIAHSTGNWDVVHIISRRTTPESQVTSQLKQSLFSSQGATLLEKAISAEAVKLGVHVSPRYGHWDAKTDSVVANSNSVSSSTSSPSATASP